MNLRGKLSGLFGLNALIWLAMFVVLAALLCLATAAWLALAPAVGLAWASLITGLGLLVVAAALILWLARAGRTPPVEEPPPLSAEVSLEESLRPLIGDRAVEWTRRNGPALTVGAFAAGVIVAACPSARRALTRAAGPVVTRRALGVLRSLDQDQ